MSPLRQGKRSSIGFFGTLQGMVDDLFQRSSDRGGNPYTTPSRTRKPHSRQRFDVLKNTVGKTNTATFLDDPTIDPLDAIFPNSQAPDQKIQELTAEVVNTTLERRRLPMIDFGLDQSKRFANRKRTPKAGFAVDTKFSKYQREKQEYLPKITEARYPGHENTPLQPSLPSLPPELSADLSLENLLPPTPPPQPVDFQSAGWRPSANAAYSTHPSNQRNTSPEAEMNARLEAALNMPEHAPHTKKRQALPLVDGPAIEEDPLWSSQVAFPARSARPSEKFTDKPIPKISHLTNESYSNKRTVVEEKTMQAASTRTANRSAQPEEEIIGPYRDKESVDMMLASYRSLNNSMDQLLKSYFDNQPSYT